MSAQHGYEKGCASSAAHEQPGERGQGGEGMEQQGLPMVMEGEWLLYAAHMDVWTGKQPNYSTLLSSPSSATELFGC